MLMRENIKKQHSCFCEHVLKIIFEDGYAYMKSTRVYEIQRFACLLR